MLTTDQLRSEYGADCTERAKAGAQEAWDELAAWMERHQYRLRQADTGARSCRAITGGTKKSLHAAFLAVAILLWNLGKRIAGAVACDFNWNTNPYGPRLVTDMPRAMVDAICGLRTRSGAQVFRWGGYYSGNKDAMHFELVCSARDLATGIDPATTAGHAAGAVHQEDDDMKYELRRPDSGDDKDRTFLVGQETYRYIDDPKALEQLEQAWGATKPINAVAWWYLVQDLKPVDTAPADIAAAIAAGIPKDLAAQVATELAKRLAA